MKNIDLLTLTQTDIKYLDKGRVMLLDSMPRLGTKEGGDSEIADAARVSYGRGINKRSNDRNLIRYLMRHRHTSPFEMVSFKFYIKLPIFVQRQLIRHRTGKVNEYSGRYSIMSHDCYLPNLDRIQPQSLNNKQGTNEELTLPLDIKEKVQKEMFKEQNGVVKNYEQYLDNGVTRELSRINLPVSNYTELIWKMDLHNLLHFLKLRLDSHSQYEIRVLANIIYNMIKPIVPITIEAFDDYIINSKYFSKQEYDILINSIDQSKLIEIIESNLNLSDREKNELIKKIK